MVTVSHKFWFLTNNHQKPELLVLVLTNQLKPKSGGLLHVTFHQISKLS